MNFKFLRFSSAILFLLLSKYCSAGDIVIKNNPTEKVVVFGNSKIKLTLDYNNKCNISGMEVNGQTVISGSAGIFSSVRTATNTYSSLKLISDPVIKINQNTVTVSNIKYGNNEELVIENWKFNISETEIRLDIERNIPKALIVEEAAFPSFNFR